MSDFMKRLQAMADMNTPVDELIAQTKARRAAAENMQADHFEKQFKEADMKRSVGRSGILPMHMNCRINNFEVRSADMLIARNFSRTFVDNFAHNNGGGFIFSGSCGTGKNHLAAAICNELIDSGKSCLIITVNELMQKLRNCYQKDSETTEDRFIKSMIEFDLLVIDEIGLQRNSDSERLAINQIVDGRISRFKPTGMLTNLAAGSEGKKGDINYVPNINDFLGVRVMDRMRSQGGQWVDFVWESYRK